MKKLFLSALSFLFAVSLLSQQVPRDMVVLEIGTGTWCQFCPGAAMGADDLIANGCEVAVIENHNGDAFANAASNARNSYYGISGYPTAFFDGVLSYAGGSNTQSMYNNYLPLYQQRIAIPSDFTIEIYGENTGLNYNILLVINKVAGSWSNLKVHLALTESEIVYAWQGQNHLNFVNRLMAPDHNGTTVNFSTLNEIEIPLSFTLDASWVTAHCELVAFIQNDATKEILQGAKVALADLEPMQATAGFACNSTTPCVNSSVAFEDQSGGQIVSWNWTFEGGNPPTSSAQNPEVSYGALGDYDVSLTVYDGTVYSTMTMQDYIVVITDPVQANTPWGEAELCAGTTSATYYTNMVPWALTYLWSVEPAEAGTIAGPDTNATFIPAAGYMGTFQVKVRAINNCGDGTWSEAFQAGIYYSPMQFTLSDGAGYCEGGPGIEVTLDGSETGVNYQLYRGNTAVGSPMAGTGSALNFGYQTEQGIYTCMGSTDHCSAQMVGNTYIYIMQAPGAAATPTGSAQECNLNTGVAYSTAGAPNSTAYQWTLSPAAAGTITGSGLTATVDWADDFTGMASIAVQGINDCGSGPVSQNLQVTVGATPEPAVTGDQDVCDFDQGVMYATAEFTGNTYNWEVTGGTITSGAGTHEIQVSWGAAGAGSVKVTEVTAEGCEASSELAINIDDCTGIGEPAAGQMKVYPNPAGSVLHIKTGSVAGQGTNVIILNAFGQQMISREVPEGTSTMQIELGGMAPGIYTVQLKDANSKSIQRKFVKSE